MISLRECFFFSPSSFSYQLLIVFFFQLTRLHGDRTTTTLRRGIETRVRSDSLSRHSRQTQHLHRTSAHWPPSPFLPIEFWWISNTTRFLFDTMSWKKLYFWKWPRLEIITFFQKNTLFLRNKFILYRIIRQRSFSSSYV